MGDRRSVGASSCNSGDGTDQRVQSLMFMMMITEQLLIFIFLSYQMLRDLIVHKKMISSEQEHGTKLLI